MRPLWTLLITVFVVGAMMATVFAEEAHKTATHEDVAPSKQDAKSEGEHHTVALIKPSNGSEACLASAATLEDLKKQRSEIEAKQKEIAAKESELKAREVALEDELKKLQEIRDQIAQADELQKKGNEEKVTKLVETIEGMSPKAASQLIASVDETLAVAAMSRVSTQRLSKIMNVMDTKRSSRLAEILAGVARARIKSTASNGAAVAATEKGGIPNEHNESKQGNNRNGEPVEREPSGTKQ